MSDARVTTLRKRATSAIVGVAFAGMAGAHWLTYRLAHADDHVRRSLLEETGHRYWPLFSLLAMAALALSVGVFIVRSACARTPVASTGSLLRTSFWKLASLQCGFFLALELFERAVVLGRPEAFWGDPLLGLGITLQFVTAFVVLLILAGSGLIAARVANVLGSSLRPPKVVVSSITDPAARPTTNEPANFLWARGPPSGSAAT